MEDEMSKRMKRLKHMKDVQERQENQEATKSVYMIETLPGPRGKIFAVASLNDFIKLSKNEQLLYGDIILHTHTNYLWIVSDPSKLPSIEALTLRTTDGDNISIEDARSSWLASPEPDESETYKTNRILKAMRAQGLIF